MSDLCGGWALVAIGDLCELVNGRAFKPSEWSQAGLPIVRIQNLNSISAAFNLYAGDYSPKHYLQGGELLFAWSGTPGTSFGAHVWKGESALLNQHIFRVDFDPGLLDKRFFRHAINQKLEDLIGAAQGGVGLRHVTKGVFEATKIAIAPRQEQQRIADKLDALLARVDACRERLDRLPGILKRFRQSVLTAAMSGDLSAEWRDSKGRSGRLPVFIESDLANVPRDAAWLSLPSTWRVVRAQDVVEPDAAIVYGIVQPGPKLASGVRYVQITDIVDGRIQLPNLCHTSEEIAYGYRRSSIKGGDVLLGIIRALKVAVVPAELDGANISRSVARLRPREGVLPTFLAYALQSPVVQDWLRSQHRGMDMPVLNLSEVRLAPIPMAPMDEQAEIVRRVDALFALADAIEARCTAARAQVERLTPSLLAKAFRGELVPQDPNDEPASELLARLRQQRENDASTAGKPGRRKSARKTTA